MVQAIYPEPGPYVKGTWRSTWFDRQTKPPPPHAEPGGKGEIMHTFDGRIYYGIRRRLADKTGALTSFKKLAAPFVTISLLMIMALTLSGCGGSGSGLSSEVVSGVAAVGAPLSGEVHLKDSSPSRQVRTAVIGNDGSFAIDVSGMTGPFVLQCEGGADGRRYKLHSYADRAGIANINPLSDAIVASAAEVEEPSEAYEEDDSEHVSRLTENFTATVDIMLTKLQPLLKRYNAHQVNPITSRYRANHLDIDAMFDDVEISVKNGQLVIVNEKTDAIIYSGKVSDIARGNFYPENVPPSPATPVMPAAVTATVSGDQGTITWSPVSNATSYNIYYSTSPGVSPATGTRIPTVTSPFVKGGLTAGTTYYFIVTALNSAGESPASAEVSATPVVSPPQVAIPSAPVNVVATGGTSQVTVSWSQVSGATSYNLYYGTASGVTAANGTKISGATTPAVHGGLTPGATYYYIVTAVNDAGESPASVQVAASTLSPVPVPVAPATPTGVSASGGANQITISWPAVAGASSYNIYRATASGVTPSSGTKIVGVTSPYINTGLSAGTAYYYVVTAVNGAGESAASVQASATTNPAPPALPAAPAGVSATGGASQVTLDWGTVTGATSYNVYWSTTSGVTTAGTKIAAASRPYVHTGLSAGTTYYYIVTAVNSAGEGSPSAQTLATTNAAAPPPASCTTCHGTPPTTGSHGAHDFASCSTCHGTGYSATAANPATHMNGVKNVGGTSGWNAASRTCSNSCHGSRSW